AGRRGRGHREPPPRGGGAVGAGGRRARGAVDARRAPARRADAARRDRPARRRGRRAAAEPAPGRAAPPDRPWRLRRRAVAHHARARGRAGRPARRRRRAARLRVRRGRRRHRWPRRDRGRPAARRASPANPGRRRHPSRAGRRVRGHPPRREPLVGRRRRHDHRARRHRRGPRAGARAHALRRGLRDRAPARGRAARAAGTRRRATIATMATLLNRRQRVREPEDSPLGRVRVDASTKTLTKRLQPGEVAVIDHVDIDRVSAEALASIGPSAVLNAARSTSGRYPNVGPQILVEAGIPLIDDLGPASMELTEGARVRIDGGVVQGPDDEVIAEGTRQTPETVAEAMEAARAGLSEQIEAFATNTMDYIRRERELLLDGIGVPDVTTDMSGRHVLIVVRGYSYKEDLAMLRPYIREYRPLLIGVDGGADAILEAGLRLDMIVGDMDSVSDK